MGECMILRRNGAYTGTMAGQPLGFKAVSNRIGSIDLSWTTVPEDTAYAALREERLRFRLEDAAHRLHTVSVKQVVSVKEVQYVGIEALIYLCRADFGGRERLFELRYTVRSHRWVLLRMVY